MSTTYGSFAVGAKLGQGGMGVVYKAQHPMLDEPAVVKVLLEEFTSNEDIRTRFINEARAARKIKHDNIVKVHDCGQASTGELYIALEFLDGVSLSGWMEGKTNAGVAMKQPGRGLPISPVQIVRILVQVAGALHAAHEYRADGVDGIVHRDVKPDNVFLIARPAERRRSADDLFPKLLDFGIAKLHESSGALTRSGAIIGTPAFMAPEQIARANEVDRRADVWALGIMLYMMLTDGWHPWSDGNGRVPDFAELYRLQTSQHPPDPRARISAISTDFAEVVTRSLACDPRERWESALVFARALAEALPAELGEPSGSELLRRHAEELWDPDDPLERLKAPPSAVKDSRLWTPPQSAISIVTGGPVAPPVSMPTRSLGPPPRGVPFTTLGSSAGQSAAAPAPPRASSRTKLYVGLGAVASAGLVAGAITLGMNSGADVRTESGLGSPSPSPTVPIDAAPMTPVAILTEPTGAVVFIEDELAGSSPHKATLAAGRSVRVRAELGGYAIKEETHVVGSRPDTIRIALARLPDAATPMDASTPDAGTTVRKPPGKRRPPGSGAGAATKSAEPNGAGSGSSSKFDPDGISE